MPEKGNFNGIIVETNDENKKEQPWKQPKKESIKIFSDEYGVLGSFLKRKHNKLLSAGSNGEENFDNVQKSLESQDTVIIFISKVNGSTLSYFKQIEKVISNKECKFKIILCSILYHNIGRYFLYFLYL